VIIDKVVFHGGDQCFSKGANQKDQRGGGGEKASRVEDEKKT